MARGKIARPKETDEIDGDHRVRTSTWSALAPLALPDLPEEIGHRLVKEHLLDTKRYWTPYPAPSVSIAEPSFEPSDYQTLMARRYWRGPTWINSAWMLWIGLRRLGYEQEANQMGTALIEAYAANGSREFYEPFTGEGLGATEFGWSTLIAELADPGPGGSAEPPLAGPLLLRELLAGLDLELGGPEGLVIGAPGERS